MKFTFLINGNVKKLRHKIIFKGKNKLKSNKRQPERTLKINKITFHCRRWHTKYY